MASLERLESARPLKGLWLARELPFPADMGDRIYSGNLAKALADAGADLTFVGLQSDCHEPPPADWALKWNTVTGRRRAAVPSALSTMPLVAASFATAGYRARVRSLLRQRWDFVVVDQLALGWAVKFVESASRDGARAFRRRLRHVRVASDTSIGSYRDLPRAWRPMRRTRRPHA